MRVFVGAVATVAVLGAALVGCGGGARTPYVKPSVYSLPVQDGQKIGSAKYPFPAAVGAGRMEVYYQGYGVRKVAGYPQPSLRIQVSCENDSDAPVAFDTAQSHIVDNRGDVLRCGGANRDGAPAESFEEVRPHTHAQFDLFFDLPATYPMEKLESFRAYWRYKAGERVVAENTNFIRQDVKNILYRDRDGTLRPHDYFLAVRDAGTKGE